MLSKQCREIQLKEQVMGSSAAYLNARASHPWNFHFHNLIRSKCRVYPSGQFSGNWLVSAAPCGRSNEMIHGSAKMVEVTNIIGEMSYIINLQRGAIRGRQRDVEERRKARVRKNDSRRARNIG